MDGCRGRRWGGRDGHGALAAAADRLPVRETRLPVWEGRPLLSSLGKKRGERQRMRWLLS